MRRLLFPLTAVFFCLLCSEAMAAGSITFTPTKADLSPAQRAIPYTDSFARFTDQSGKTVEQKLVYHHLFYSDDRIPSGSFAGQFYGGLIDADNKQIQDVDGNPRISDNPDGNSLILVGKRGNSARLKLLTHFEYDSSAYRHFPMFTGISSLKQNRQTGELRLTAYKKQNYKAVNGIWTPCISFVTEWGSHLSAEENEPDARLWAMGGAGGRGGLTAIPFMQNYLDEYPVQKSTPYQYGFIVESKLQQGEIKQIARHYSLGRFSHEKIEVMPDGRTSFMSDDRPFAAMFMAVADRADDLSANTLYAARWDQTSGSGAGAADLQWIRLGHATDRDIKAIIGKGISFMDIFDTAPVPAIGFVTVRVGRGHTREYLRLKPGMEKAAAFLESRRYAAYLGATTEFSGPEGMTFNKADKKIYLAMTKVTNSMANDIGRIRVDEVKSGAVYELQLQGGKAEDQNGERIDSEWVATAMQAILAGSDRSVADKLGNTADINAIANPDNLSFSPASRYLFIGEDSSKHVSNYLWAYHIDSGQLVRLLSVPVGAEIAGLEVIDNLNGFMYILCNFQHPGGKGAATPELLQKIEDSSPGFAAGKYRHAGVGYLAIQRTGKSL